MGSPPNKNFCTDVSGSIFGTPVTLAVIAAIVLGRILIAFFANVSKKLETTGILGKPTKKDKELGFLGRSGFANGVATGLGLATVNPLSL